MRQTEEWCRPLNGAHYALEPLALPIPAAVRVSGLSRSAIYREASAGHIRLMKLGRSTLVDMASVRVFLATLPDAQLRMPRASI
jgi:hypothetical protein